MPLHDWYDGNPDLSSKYQGDVLEDVAILVPPPAGKGLYLLRPSSPVTVSEALAGRVPKWFLPRAEKDLADAWETGAEYVLTRARRGRVQIVTQTCDLDRRPAVQVAPVREIVTLENDKKRDSVRGNEVGYFQYLPATEKFPDSYSDLSQMTWLPRSALQSAPILSRFTPSALIAFQRKVSLLHGRPFTFTSSDQVPQGGRYLCYICFAVHSQIREIEATDGTFPQCQACGEAHWIKAVSRQSAV